MARFLDDRPRSSAVPASRCTTHPITIRERPPSTHCSSRNRRITNGFGNPFDLSMKIAQKDVFSNKP